MARSPMKPGQANSPGGALEPLTDAGSGPWTPSLRVLLAAVFSVDALTALVVIAYSNPSLIDIREAPSAYPSYALAIYGFVKLVAAPAGWLFFAEGLGSVTGPLLVGAVIALGGVREGMVALGLGGLARWLAQRPRGCKVRIPSERDGAPKRVRASP